MRLRKAESLGRGVFRVNAKVYRATVAEGPKDERIELVVFPDLRSAAGNIDELEQL